MLSKDMKFYWRILTFILMSISANASSREHFIAGTLAGVRDFYLYSPSKNPSGLIIMLHGCKTTAEEFNQGTEMSKYAASKNFAVLYPEQSGIANPDHCWNWFWGVETPIIAAGVQKIQKRFHLNRDQTYLVGMSAGAAQVTILANCQRDLFSKVLIHSGLQYLAATDLTQAQDSLEHGAHTSSTEAASKGLLCNSSLKPVQFMVVHGTADTRVNPINGNQTKDELLKLNQLIAIKNNSSSALSKTTKINPAHHNKLGYIQDLFYIDGKYIGSMIKVDGLTHEWSGGNPVQPRNNPKGPSVIELFFQSFQL